MFLLIVSFPFLYCPEHAGLIFMEEAQSFIEYAESFYFTFW